MVMRKIPICRFLSLLLALTLLPMFLKRCVSENEITTKRYDSVKTTTPSEGQRKQNPGAKFDPSSFDCSVRLADPDTFPLVPLISPPGAGNTWLRHLIEQATGFYTGSVYRDVDLYKGGLLAEFEDFMEGNTLTVKAHNAIRLARICKAAILLLRNPIDIAIAERNRRNQSDHIGLATWNEDLRADEAWREFVQAQFDQYGYLVNGFLNLQVPTLVVHYENIRDNTVGEVKRIVKFLNMTMNKERKLCVENNSEGNFHRHNNDTKTPYKMFTNKMKCHALALMTKVSRLLTDHGHEPLPCIQDNLISDCNSIAKILSPVKPCE
ncbi:sialate:O-sulfotransferase 1-like [Ptychodera flava]|uniref:sialate:O-sulfotransferase 1-like n=1 Tax=Ptychodera flava TaxID=63121 RepID=UPI00396A8F4A